MIRRTDNLTHHNVQVHGLANQRVCKWVKVGSTLRVLRDTRLSEKGTEYPVGTIEKVEARQFIKESGTYNHTMLRKPWVTLTLVIRIHSSYVYTSVREFETSHSKYFR